MLFLLEIYSMFPDFSMNSHKCTHAKQQLCIALMQAHAFSLTALIKHDQIRILLLSGFFWLSSLAVKAAGIQKSFNCNQVKSTLWDQTDQAVREPPWSLWLCFQTLPLCLSHCMLIAFSHPPFQACWKTERLVAVKAALLLVPLLKQRQRAINAMSLSHRLFCESNITED